MPKLPALEVLRPVWWVGLLAFGVALIATPIMRAIAYKTKIVDKPDALLKPHARPIAYLGGVAICIGLLAGLACSVAAMDNLGEHWTRLKQSLTSFDFAFLVDNPNPLWSLMAIGVSSLLIMVVGLVDDICDMKPRTKVLGQVIAAGILLCGGVGITMAKPFFVLVGLNPPAWILMPCSAMICVVLVICTCNATNLLDGLDGLCGGVTVFISIGFLALAVWLGMWDNFPGTDQLRVVLCLAMAGAVLGFLPYNIPPASIFMGDAGSMLLGFFVATMMAYFCQEGPGRWLLASFAVFALPILDTGLAVVRRLVSGKSIFAGDRSHLYDQLVDRGMTVKQVVLLFYVLSVVAAVVGVTLAIYVRARVALVVYVIALIIIWTVFYKMGMISPEKRKAKQSSDADSE